MTKIEALHLITSSDPASWIFYRSIKNNPDAYREVVEDTLVDKIVDKTDWTNLYKYTELLRGETVALLARVCTETPESLTPPDENSSILLTFREISSGKRVRKDLVLNMNMGENITKIIAGVKFKLDD